MTSNLRIMLVEVLFFQWHHKLFIKYFNSDEFSHNEQGGGDDDEHNKSFPGSLMTNNSIHINAKKNLSFSFELHNEISNNLKFWI